MDDYFEIPVHYKGEDRSFTARLLKMGYVHKFEVTVNGRLFYFEQDDEGSYRALADVTDDTTRKDPDVGLLQSIAAAIESILK